MMAPGPQLAMLADEVWRNGLDALSDDELIGVLRAARRLASRATALELTAVADLASVVPPVAAGLDDQDFRQKVQTETSGQADQTQLSDWMLALFARHYVRPGSAEPVFSDV